MQEIPSSQVSLTSAIINYSLILPSLLGTVQQDTQRCLHLPCTLTAELFLTLSQTPFLLPLLSSFIFHLHPIQHLLLLRFQDAASFNIRISDSPNSSISILSRHYCARRFTTAAKTTKAQVCSLRASSYRLIASNHPLPSATNKTWTTQQKGPSCVQRPTASALPARRSSTSLSSSTTAPKSTA